MSKRKIDSDSNVGNSNAEVRFHFNEVVSQIEAKMKLLEEKEASLKAREAHLADMDKKMEEHAAAAPKKIILDIGGRRFATSKDTLLSAKESFFYAMLASDRWKPDADGAFFIDRDPELFPLILSYLRDGELNLERYGYDVTASLQRELDFYQITIPELSQQPRDATIRSFANSQILEDSHKEKLNEWLNNPKATLIYSGTRNGFGAKDFHEHCDNKGKTVTIVQTADGDIFGGFTEALWSCSGTFRKGNNWIFTLSNRHKTKPLRFFPQNEKYGIYCSKTTGPCFGLNDIIIIDHSNKYSFSTTYFPQNYKDTSGIRNFCLASPMFLTKEIEVFLLE